MKRIFTIFAALLLFTGILGAQPVRGIFSFADSLMRNSRIGTAGREPFKNITIKPSVWEAAPYDKSIPARYASDEQGFVFYLLDRGLRQDALTLLAQPCYVPSDTLSYLRGISLFDDLQLVAADRYLSSSSLEPALFYDVVAKAHLGLYDDASAILKSYKGPRQELCALQTGGISLLRGDTAAYSDAASHYTYSDYNLTESQRVLDDLAERISSHHDKSQLAAGIFSALLPGAGQLYAGSLGEALSAFLTVGSLAGITAVNWNKYGLKSWRTIVSGSLCSIFYIGNIYGACVSVGIQNQQFQDETQALVLYHIHISLRGIYR